MIALAPHTLGAAEAYFARTFGGQKLDGDREKEFRAIGDRGRSRTPVVALAWIDVVLHRVREGPDQSRDANGRQEPDCRPSLCDRTGGAALRAALLTRELVSWTPDAETRILGPCSNICKWAEVKQAGIVGQLGA